jgi:hypothetical protein
MLYTWETSWGALSEFEGFRKEGDEDIEKIV